ncbi:hypothetical protein BSQ39_12265 [Loigolactobacillus backii]|uniref:PaaX family transcriptional regulator C-terminal domain-containing protein n=1 Tax=Loigolactobacillus backii TaxID=375175 RepID=UPI000C1CA25F|nr:PaaX family transcriptional regulator C-terminal domain-containing protein [Loigolactobacillus backii]PIO84286.1 hypothetical protein BSQ39_12265 [Loigolactobacillus backii]
MQSVEKQILHLIDVGEEVHAKTLVAIFTKRNYTEMTVRNTLSKLKNQGRIISRRRGLYALTAEGKKRLSDINLKYNNYQMAFDGNWTFVFIRIPEEKRKAKAAFKTALQEYGFAPYQSSVYVSPWHYGNDVLALAQEIGVTSDVKVVKGTFFKTRLTRQEAFQMWHLKTLTQTYQTEYAWIKEKMAHTSQVVASGDDQALLNLYLDIGNHINTMFLLDPILPQSLLPPDWIGQKTLQLLITGYNSIAEIFPKQSPYAKFMTPMFT